MDGVVNEKILQKAQPIKLLLTDCDGVLTDGCVYYSAQGEEMKKFSLRDGMGAERLRRIIGVETGIVSGEASEALRRRGEKLHVTELHLGIRDKLAVMESIMTRRGLGPEEIAYIGDDVNDTEVVALSGLTACPSDAMPQIVKIVDYICSCKGGAGAFREFAELLISARQ
jgi:YrbI family 3-deoxy-D-manno-octulosonate 8-phosphate phosphatase